MINSRNETLQTQLKPIYNAMAASATGFALSVSDVLGVSVGEASKIVSEFTTNARENVDEINGSIQNMAIFLRGAAKELGFEITYDQALAAAMGNAQGSAVGLFQLLQQENAIANNIISSFDAITPVSISAPITPTDFGNSSSNTSNSSSVKHSASDNSKLRAESDFETSQLAQAMLDEEGRYYEQYLDNRKSATETYVGWKADFDQLSLDEELALIKQHSADYLQQLEFLYASGAITDQQYTEAKFAEEGRALTQQRDLLLENQMDVQEIETQIGDWEIEYERYKQSELLRIQQEALEQKEKKRKAYGETVKFIESGLVSVIQNLEEYELTKAGENEEKKKAIKKKYANIDFMIALAQIASSQAQGTMAAWASAMQLGYPAGPIVGGIMTGVLAAIGVTETMIALAQRNAVMSLATGGFAGYTGPGAKYEKKQLVQLHGNEYVIPSEGMNNPYVAGVVGAIEYARQTKTLRSLNFAAANRSMASGGYVSSSSGSKVSASTSVSFPAEFYSVISGLAASQQALNAKLDNIQANISFDKIQIADRKISAAQSKSSR